MSHLKKLSLIVRTWILPSIVGASVGSIMTSCSVEKIPTPAPGNQDVIAAGELTLGEANDFAGDMSMLADLPSSYDWGMDVSFTIKLDQPTHLRVSTSYTYDCDYYAAAWGPQYYLYLEDGSSRVLDDETSHEWSKIPGTSTPAYPGLTPAGIHRMIVRFYAKEECDVQGNTKILNQYDFEEGRYNALDYGLARDWQKHDDATEQLRVTSFRNFRWTSAQGEVNGEIAFFPYETPTKIVLKATTSTGEITNTWKAGSTRYCQYQVATEAGSPALSLACSAPDVSTFPENFDQAVKFNKISSTF
jgi:hypothetical protein